MKSFMFSTLLFTAAISSFAANSNQWTLVRKLAGPSSWTCPQNLESTIGSQSFILQETEGQQRFSLNFDPLDGKTHCNRSQNGSPFGSLTCEVNIARMTHLGTKYETKSCGTDLPFIQSCRPQTP